MNNFKERLDEVWMKSNKNWSGLWMRLSKTSKFRNYVDIILKLNKRDLLLTLYIPNMLIFTFMFRNRLINLLHAKKRPKSFAIVKYVTLLMYQF